MASRRKIMTIMGGILVGSSSWYKRDTISTGGLTVKEYSTNQTTLGGIQFYVKVQNINPINPASGDIVTEVSYEDGSSVTNTKEINELPPLSTNTYNILISPSIENRLQSKY